MGSGERDRGWVDLTSVEGADLTVENKVRIYKRKDKQRMMRPEKEQQVHPGGLDHQAK